MAAIFDIAAWEDPALLTAQVASAMPPFALPFVAVRSESMSGAGGNSGEMTRLHATDATGAEVRFVLKTTRAAGAASSKSLELYREAMFYKKLLHTFGEAAVPRIFVSEWDVATGRKCILMGDLADAQAVQAGYFFGDNSCLNKGKDLVALTKAFPALTELDVSRKAFTVAAQLHGAFVGDESLLAPEFEFLKGQHWFKGEARDSWNATVGFAKEQWVATKARLQQGTCTIHFAPRVLQFVDRSFACTFDDYVAAVHSIPFTLCHGDFHPANFMVTKDENSPDNFGLKVLDFEVVGIGSGAQDLGQFMVSHSFPHVRRAHEEQLLRHYHDVLSRATREGGRLPTLDEVRREYVVGGLGRWVWLLAVVSTLCPEPMTQYFQDQVEAFLNDHVLVHKDEPIVPRP